MSVFTTMAKPFRAVLDALSRADEWVWQQILRLFPGGGR